MFYINSIESYLDSFQRKIQQFRHWLLHSRWALLAAFIICSFIIICSIIIVWSIVEQKNFQKAEQDEIMLITSETTTTARRRILEHTTQMFMTTEFDLNNNHFDIKKLCDNLCKHDPELGGQLCDCDEPPMNGYHAKQ
ncbi:hypothetical protein DERF_000173 [Dermatophagoides farinae]|uniref:Uncharacterized protein n=1 Tax=Dermatophagoides farinae TaxID=6954 RepID=A0A922I9F6_DERFA|nr:hypothetical protein HUG17_8029 [Dermatophagoides farinae]KAH9526056.1 hypothetical protein DERF_000173 [Dermatophagoides farinae]